MSFKAVPTKNSIQSTVDATFSAAATTLTLADDLSSYLSTVSATNPGVFVVDRIDTNGNLTPSKREYCTFTGVSGAQLTGITKNADSGNSDQEHAVGAVVEFVADVLWAQAAQDTFETEHNADGTHATDAINAITEIASAIKSGSDATLVTGTAGTNTYVPQWNADGDLVDGYAFLDEDTLSSDSATAVASQQSIKAYVDNAVSTDGWITSSDTWTYASATSFTISGVDRTSVFTKGTKIKLTNDGGTDYYYVTSSSFSTNTTVNLTGGTDYSLANSAITNPFYSYADNPQGFPHWFTYTPTITPDGSMTYGTLSYGYNKFTIQGNKCTFKMRVNGTTGGSASTFMDVTTPVTMADADSITGVANVDTNNATMGKILDAGNTTEFRVYRYDAGNWTLGTGRYIFAEVTFPI